MVEPKTYKTDANFRQALEQRMQQRARQSGRPIGFVRKRVCFERFLARLFKHSEANWAVKGGYRLELAFSKSRTTKDVDLVLSDKGLLAAKPEEQTNAMLAMLQEAASFDMADFFEFQVSLKEAIKHATIGGARYSVRAVVAGREFDTFRLDVVLAETDKARMIPLDGQNWLDFAGIEPPTIYAINEEYQFAEKLHAYSYPWDQVENTRVKDLLDMLMLARGFTDLEEVGYAIKDIFAIRGKQAIPEKLLKPPDAWRPTFDMQAAEYEFQGTMENCYVELSERYARLRQTEVIQGKIQNAKEKTPMVEKTRTDLNVDELLEMLGKAFPVLRDKTLTECIAIAVKESQTSTTTASNQWRAVLQALLTAAIVGKIDNLSAH